MKTSLLPQRYPVGIDIGSSAIKAVAIDTQSKPPCIAGYAIEPQPTPRGEQTTDRCPLSQAIQAAVARTTKRPGVIAAAIPASVVLTRELSLPSRLDTAAIAARVQLAVHDELHQPTDALRYDFRPIDRINPSKANTPIQLLACRRDEIEQRLSLLKTAKLSCDVIDIDAHAIARAAITASAPKPNEPPIALLDAGQAALHCSILHGDQLIHSQDHDWLAVTDHDEQLMTIHRALALYQSRPESQSLGGIQLTGGQADALGEQRISAHCGLRVQTINPLPQLGTSEQVDPIAIQRDLPRLLTGLGLALHAGDQHAHWR
jgi:type IV pilus assembly protein PilM